MGMIGRIVGGANVPTDGQTMGDALPPAIPLEGNGRSSAIH